MLIKIDNRENDLIPLIERRIQAYDQNIDDTPSSKKNTKNSKNGCLIPDYIFNEIQMNNDILHSSSCADNNTAADATGATGVGEYSKLYKIKIEQLHIGDIVIEDDYGKTILIFERKTLNDLAASIKDGRYNEQSFRLNKEQIHNHNIIYIIEGDIERYNEKRTHISKKTLISSMFSLLYYKGFSVLRTNGICETADTIVFFADKYDKTRINEKNRKPYYELTTRGVETIQSVVEELNESEESEKYCGVVKGHKEKNEYITPENINIIMLSCIPGINSKTATQIMSEYKTVQNLLYQLEMDPTCLNTFMIKTELGNMRKINKNCVDNIKKFLCANK